jgi:hypothetical protein
MGTNRDEKIEKWLASYEAEYEYVNEMSIKDIDVAGSLVNQARIGPSIIDELIEIYTAAWDKGDIFPPIVLARIDEGESHYITVDGNHRLQVAIKKGLKSYPFGAYLLKDISEMVRHIMTYEANETHGKPASMIDRIHHAIFLVQHYGVDRKESAERMGIPLSRLSEALLDREIGNRIRSTGIKGIDKIVPTTRKLLNLIKLDKPFRNAVELAVKAKMPTGQAEEMVHNVIKCNSEEGQLKYLEMEKNKMAKIIKESGGMIRKYNRESAAIYRSFTSILKIKKESIRVLPNAYQRKLINRMDEAIVWIGELKRTANAK